MGRLAGPIVQRIAASGRQEYTIAVGTSVISTLSRPFPCAVVLQFLQFIVCRYVGMRQPPPQFT